MNNESKVMPPSLGSILQIAVTADIGKNIHLSDVDFNCTFYCNDNPSRCIVVKKEQMTMLSDDTYASVVDTNKIGVGEYWCCLTVYVPDDSVPGGRRREVIRFSTNIPVVP